MAEPAEFLPTPPRHDDAALSRLPLAQLRWATAQAAAGAAALWWAEPVSPEWLLVALLALGSAAVVAPDLKQATIALLSTFAAGALAAGVGLPPFLGAAPAAGAAAAGGLATPVDRMDRVNAALGVLAGAALGLWAAARLAPLAGGWATVAAAALVGMGASQGLFPVAWRHDRPMLPGRLTLVRALDKAHLGPVQRAFALYRGMADEVPDVTTRRGVHEVALWVFRLQGRRQALLSEAVAVEPEAVSARLAALAASAESDAFTRDRIVATETHLRRLLEHHAEMIQEANRTASLVDYALAFLEESRAGLILGRLRPGADTPELGEVLHRLRGHATTRAAVTRTRRELTGPLGLPT